MRLDRSRIVLSALEAVYLMQSGLLIIEKEGTTITPGEYLGLIAPSDVEIHEKVVVYGDFGRMGTRRRRVTSSATISGYIPGRKYIPKCLFMR